MSDTRRRMHELVVVSGLIDELVPIRPRRATEDELRRADITRVRKINERMRAALTDIDPMQFSTLNREFHFMIYDRCPNAHIRPLLDAQWSRLDTIRRSVFAFVPGRAKSSVAEHTEIVDLIAMGAPVERIEQAARTHKLHTAGAMASARRKPRATRTSRES